MDAVARFQRRSLFDATTSIACWDRGGKVESSSFVGVASGVRAPPSCTIWLTRPPQFDDDIKTSSVPRLILI